MTYLAILSRTKHTLTLITLFWLSLMSVTLSAMSNGDGDKAYIAQDYQEALKTYQIDADSGDAHAQSMLGYMYVTGKGTNVNRQLAFKYFTQSARRGDEIGKVNLAIAYATGCFVKKDTVYAKDVLNTLDSHEIKNQGLTITKTDLLSEIDRGNSISFLAPEVLNNGGYDSNKISALPSGTSAVVVKDEPKNEVAIEAQCRELGFKPKTKQFSKCLSTLQPKNNLSNLTSQSTAAPQSGDGSVDDLTCQKYGFKVGEESYKKCRLDLKIAADEASSKLAQYEVQKRAYEQQVRQYEEQKRLYEARVAAAQAEKDREDTWNLLTFGAALINGRSVGDSAYALRGQPVPPRQYYPITPPAQPSIPNFTLNTPRGSAYCSYNNMTNQMNCH